MTSANLTREETAARSAAITLHRVAVELDVSDAAEPARTGYPTRSVLTFDATTDTTWVDFLGESVQSVTVNGQEQPVEYDGARITVRGLAASNEVVIEATAAYSRSGEGMHRFVDPVDGQTYLYTQYEPADARRVMACFEQPDMKARYAFTVTAPTGWEVLSNQHPISETRRGETQTVVFAETLPLSTYITAVAAGPYHRVSGSWQGERQTLDLGVLCRASLAPHLDADEILEITRQGFDFFTRAFAHDYPWGGKYDQIFVPEYNLGAMENPGLVTFTEAYIFRGAATEAQREARANTILHEMAHMWFGDLVTMRWWDDLWLKESFADYMGAHASAAATRFSEAWTTFANRRKAWAYTQDQLPTTHPIVADIPDLEAAKLNFDGITYAKGASVLKQLVAFVGEEAFFEGARRYFDGHAFGNTTLDDLLAELEATSGRDLRAWSSAWLETSGVTTMRIESGAAGAVIVQDPPRPHRLGIGLYRMRDGVLSLAEVRDLDVVEERTPIDLPAVDLVLLNHGDLSYVKARLDEKSTDAAAEALSTIDDSLARGLIWSALWNATRDGELSADRYLAIVTAHAGAERNIGLLTAVLANAAFAVRHYVTDRMRAVRGRAWLDVTRAELDAAAPGLGAQLAWARAFAEAAAFDGAHAMGIRGMLAGHGPEGLAMDADLRWALLGALATTGHASEADIAEELALDDTAAGRTAALRARASRPEAAVRAAAWESAWGDATLTNDHLDATIAGFRAGARRDLIAPFDDDYFAALLPAWRERSIEIARRLVVGLFPASDSLEPADRWLDTHPDAPAALRRLVIEQRDHLARDLRVRAAQGS